MRFLNPEFEVVIIHLEETAESSSDTLSDYASPSLKTTPYFVLDVTGILLSSSQLGDIVNFAKTVQEQWGPRFSGLRLIHASDHAEKVVQATKLTQILKVLPNLDAAYNDIQQHIG